MAASANRASILAALALLASCSTPPAIDAASEASTAFVQTTRDGAFTAAQAEQGERVFTAHCASCHPLSYFETQFLVWQNATLGEFIGALSATMPSENPGALAGSQYLDVTAYILSMTGSTPGTLELTADRANEIRIVGD